MPKTAASVKIVSSAFDPAVISFRTRLPLSEAENSLVFVDAMDAGNSKKYYCKHSPAPEQPNPSLEHRLRDMITASCTAPTTFSPRTAIISMSPNSLFEHHNRDMINVSESAQSVAVPSTAGSVTRSSSSYNTSPTSIQTSSAKSNNTTRIYSSYSEDRKMGRGHPYPLPCNCIKTPSYGMSQVPALGDELLTTLISTPGPAVVHNFSTSAASPGSPSPPAA
jgi:hypothetical protein